MAVSREANTEKGGKRLKSKLGPNSAVLKSVIQDIQGDWCETARQVSPESVIAG